MSTSTGVCSSGFRTGRDTKLLDLVITEQKNDLKLSGILPLGEDDHERMSSTLHLEPSKTVVICRRNCSRVNMVEIVSATEGLDRE